MSRETNEKPTITHTEIEALEDETLEDMTEVEDGGRSSVRQRPNASRNLRPGRCGVTPEARRTWPLSSNATEIPVKSGYGSRRGSHSCRNWPCVTASSNTKVRRPLEMRWLRIKGDRRTPSSE